MAAAAAPVPMCCRWVGTAPAVEVEVEAPVAEAELLVAEAVPEDTAELLEELPLAE